LGGVLIPSVIFTKVDEDEFVKEVINSKDLYKVFEPKTRDQGSETLKIVKPKTIDQGSDIN